MLELAGARVRSAGRLPAPQHDAQAAVLDGAVYVFGGGELAAYAHILRYDPVTAPSPRREASPGRPPTWRWPRSGARRTSSAATTGARRSTRSSPGAPGGPARVVGHLPTATRYAAVAALDGRLIIAGGSQGLAATAAIDSFDPRPAA